MRRPSSPTGGRLSVVLQCHAASSLVDSTTRLACRTRRRGRSADTLTSRRQSCKLRAPQRDADQQCSPVHHSDCHCDCDCHTQQPPRGAGTTDRPGGARRGLEYQCCDTLYRRNSPTRLVPAQPGRRGSYSYRPSLMTVARPSVHLSTAVTRQYSRCLRQVGHSITTRVRFKLTCRY